MLVVSSVNVNGIRAAATKGPAQWLAGAAADVGCLQETRAQPEQIPDGLFDGPGLASRTRSAVVERTPSHGERWSDHAPVTVGYGHAT